MQTQCPHLVNVPMHVITMEIVLMESATAFLDFMVMIVVDVSSHFPCYILTHAFIMLHLLSTFCFTTDFSFYFSSYQNLFSYIVPGSCPSNCNGNGMCLSNGICECKAGYTGIDCSTGKLQVYTDRYSLQDYFLTYIYVS